MEQQTTSFVRKQKILLHLLLVMGVFLYLYSPFLDHWLGNEAYGRPHNHTYISEDTISQLSYPHETDLSAEYLVDLNQHEEGVLCSLDIDVILSLLLAFNMAPGMQRVQHHPQIFELVPYYFPVSIIYLATVDRPPII